MSVGNNLAVVHLIDRGLPLCAPEFRPPAQIARVTTDRDAVTCGECARIEAVRAAAAGGERRG